MRIINIFFIFLVTVFLILVVPAHTCLRTNTNEKLDYKIEYELNLILKKSKSALDLLKSSKDPIKQAPILLKNLPEQIKKLSDRFYSFNDPYNLILIARKFARTFSNIATIANKICISRENNATLSFYSDLKKMLWDVDDENLRLLSQATYIYTYSHEKDDIIAKNSLPPIFEDARIKTKEFLMVFNSILSKLYNEMLTNERSKYELMHYLLSISVLKPGLPNLTRNKIVPV